MRSALELRPDLIGLSGLLTVATESMRATVAALHDVSGHFGRPLPVIIGGGIVGEQTCKWTGADLWADDAADGVRLATSPTVPLNALRQDLQNTVTHLQQGCPESEARAALHQLVPEYK